MYVSKGGEAYSFCPGKATWDHETLEVYRLALLATESGNYLVSPGTLLDQPDEWLDILSWFVPRYKHQLFVSRARMILGDDKTKAKAPGAEPTLVQRKGSTRGRNHR